MYIYIHMRSLAPPPPPFPFLTGGAGAGAGARVNFDYLPRRGENLKNKKGDRSMVQGQVFLKGGH